MGNRVAQEVHYFFGSNLKGRHNSTGVSKSIENLFLLCLPATVTTDGEDLLPSSPRGFAVKKWVEEKQAEVEVERNDVLNTRCSGAQRSPHTSRQAHWFLFTHEELHWSVVIYLVVYWTWFVFVSITNIPLLQFLLLLLLLLLQVHMQLSTIQLELLPLTY